MVTSEKVELGLIFLATGIVWAAAPLLPSTLTVGKMLFFLTLLVFVQSLVRDLYRLAASRRMAASEKVEMQCMCLETTLGVTTLLLAVVLMACGIGRPLVWTRWEMTELTLVAMVGCFLIKDLVLEWNPWRIRYDKNHINIIVRWRKPKESDV